MNNRILANVLIIVLAFSSYVKGEELIVFKIGDDSIYSSSNPNESRFLLEIVKETTKYLDKKVVVEFLPWRRVQLETIRSKNVVIFPLARTTERESKYKWLCKLFDIPIAFITKEDGPIIDSFKQASQLTKVGVPTGTPQEEQIKYISKKESINIQYASIDNQSIYDWLATSESNTAIYGGVPEAFTLWEQKGFSNQFGSLQHGKTLQTLSLWVATGHDSIGINSEDWKKAFNKVKASGFYSKVISKHFDSEAYEGSLP